VSLSGVGSLHELSHRLTVWDWGYHLAVIVVAGLGVGLVTRRLLSQRLTRRRSANIALFAALLNLSYWLLVGLGVGLWIAVGIWRYSPQKT